MKLLDLVSKLGDGEVIHSNGKTFFKLSSYVENPVLRPEDHGLTWFEDGLERKGAIFNPGAIIFGDKVILAPRVHKGYIRKSRYDPDRKIIRYYMENYVSRVWFFESEDGVSFRRIEGLELKPETDDFKYGIEDVRIVRMYNGEYILSGCGKVKPPFKGGDADRVAIYRTSDFREIRYCGIIDAFDSRNTFPFPELIDGKLYMVFRFHPNIHIDHLQFGYDQLINPKRYGSAWRDIYERKSENLALKAGEYEHEREKIGGGPPPIKTDEGWLLIYHSVGKIGIDITKLYGMDKEIIRGYSISAAILDVNDPKHVIARTEYPIYIPNKPWELEGDTEFEVDIPNVVFPVGSVIVKDKLLIYAGAGDKYCILLSCKLKELIDYVMRFSQR